MRTRDLDEAVAAVSKLYCAHKAEVTGSTRNIDAQLLVMHRRRSPVQG